MKVSEERGQPNLFQFTDYREYLKSYVTETKKRNRFWSQSAWAKSLKLGGAATLTMVIAGKRDPGTQLSKKLADYFKFNAKEREYFFNLIHLNKAKKDPKLYTLLLEKIARSHPNKDQFFLEPHSFYSISDWYYYSVREMVLLKDFQEDPAWIQKRLAFHISPREIKNSIEKLLNLGLLERDPQGNLRQASGEVNTTTDLACQGIRRFHEQMIRHSLESLNSTDLSLREFNASTFTIHQSRLPEAKEYIREFLREFTHLFGVSEGDEAYQMNIQLFPLTKKKGENRK